MCGLLDAFWPNFLLVYPYFPERIKRNKWSILSGLLDYRIQFLPQEEKGPRYFSILKGSHMKISWAASRLNTLNYPWDNDWQIPTFAISLKVFLNGIPSNDQLQSKPWIIAGFVKAFLQKSARFCPIKNNKNDKAEVRVAEQRQKASKSRFLLTNPHNVNSTNLQV